MPLLFLKLDILKTKTLQSRHFENVSLLSNLIYA